MRQKPESHPPTKLLREGFAGFDTLGAPWAMIKAARTPKPSADYAPVIVFPGLFTHDVSTLPLRYFLGRNGFEAEGWGLGFNAGGRGMIKDLSELSDRWDIDRTREHKGEGEVPALLDKVIDRVDQRLKVLGRPIHVVGWSLGGYLAREVARERPDDVLSVVTLAAPVIGGPKYTSLAGIYKRRGTDLDWIEAEIDKRNTVPIQQPITAIYGPNDGVINPAAMIDHHSPNVTHVEMNISHMGVGLSPKAWNVTLDALQQAEAKRLT